MHNGVVVVYRNDIHQLKPAGEKMATILPPQRLLLELFIMSGDIPVPDAANGTILQRTLKECAQNAWVGTEHVADGFDMEMITNLGRKAARKASFRVMNCTQNKVNPHLPVMTVTAALAAASGHG